MTSAAVGAVRQAAGAPAPEPFAWHDRNALASLLKPYGFGVDVDQRSLAYCASSARQFLGQETRNHPLAVAGLRILGQLGQAEALRARLLAILENGNGDPTSFRVTSRYVVAQPAATADRLPGSGAAAPVLPQSQTCQARRLVARPP